jgi:hypothetical protein
MSGMKLDSSRYGIFIDPCRTNLISYQSDRDGKLSGIKKVTQLDSNFFYKLVNPSLINLYPPNTRYCDATGGYINLILEESPKFRTLSFSNKLIYEDFLKGGKTRIEEVDEEIRNKIDSREKISLKLYMPYVCYLIQIVGNNMNENSFPQFNLYIAFKNSSMISIKDILGFAPLPNIFEQGNVCTGDSMTFADKTDNLTDTCMTIISRFWNSEFNTDANYNLVSYYPKGFSLCKWYALSKTNPTQLLRTRWNPYENTFEEIMDAGLAGSSYLISSMFKGKFPVLEESITSMTKVFSVRKFGIRFVHAYSIGDKVFLDRKECVISGFSDQRDYIYIKYADQTMHVNVNSITPSKSKRLSQATIEKDDKTNISISIGDIFYNPVDHLLVRITDLIKDTSTNEILTFFDKSSFWISSLNPQAFDLLEPVILKEKSIECTSSPNINFTVGNDMHPMKENTFSHLCKFFSYGHSYVRYLTYTDHYIEFLDSYRDLLDSVPVEKVRDRIVTDDQLEKMRSEREEGILKNISLGNTIITSDEILLKEKKIILRDIHYAPDMSHLMRNNLEINVNALYGSPINFKSGDTVVYGSSDRFKILKILDFIRSDSCIEVRCAESNNSDPIIIMFANIMTDGRFYTISTLRNLESLRKIDVEMFGTPFSINDPDMFPDLYPKNIYIVGKLTDCNPNVYLLSNGLTITQEMFESLKLLSKKNVRRKTFGLSQYKQKVDMQAGDFFSLKKGRDNSSYLYCYYSESPDCFSTIPRLVMCKFGYNFEHTMNIAESKWKISGFLNPRPNIFNRGRLVSVIHTSRNEYVESNNATLRIVKF